VTENEVGVAFWVEDTEMWKDNVTVADLIKTLQDFPPDLRVSAYFDCLIDYEDNIVSLEDKRITELTNIILECPFCSDKLHVEYEKTQQTN
jgi:hypothetical protein